LLLLKIAFRNLFLHKLKTLIVGAVIIFGTFLSIVGSSCVDSMAQSMRKSITNSITGDIQIYAKRCKRKIFHLGNMGGNYPDIGHIKDFSKIKEVLLAKLKNIKSIIPMGRELAMVSPGNIMDIKSEELRELIKIKVKTKFR